MIINIVAEKTETSIENDFLVKKLLRDNKVKSFSSIYFPLLKQQGYNEPVELYYKPFGTEIADNQVVCFDKICSAMCLNEIKPMKTEEKLLREFTVEQFVVNITTENKKKHAVVHSSYTGVDVDLKRGDKVFEDKKEADLYATNINSGKIKFENEKH